MDIASLSKSRSTRASLYLLAAIGSLLFALTTYLYTRTLAGADSPGCRPVWMYPSYARITGFDESHTKFASKYSLYLYREQGKDTVPEESADRDFKLNGVPVLFIPGNAGSYRQARSIASESANLYFDEYIHHQGHLNPHAKNLDVFTADFNEDFTAFHGRTILDQAEYLNEAIKFILDLYAVSPNPPRSVIVVGHSMGGVVSRIMVSLPNYAPDSINTILTLASPHAAAPLTFDGDLLRIYSAVDRFWYEAYHSNTSVASARLANLSLISVTGGLLDSTLPADYTTLGYLVPPSNGFTVYSTGIPQVWTPIDHLAIVWCSQLRNKLARVLLEIVDVNEPSRTKPLASRMAVFRQHLLSGFEEFASQDSAVLSAGATIDIKLDGQHINNLRTGSTKKLLIDGRHKPTARSNLFHIPKNAAEDYEFSLLTSSPLRQWNKQNQHLTVLMCSNNMEGDETTRVEADDFTNDQTQEFLSMRCVDAHTDARAVPRSDRESYSLMDSSYGGEKEPFFALKLSSQSLSKYEVILVTVNEEEQDDDFFIAGEIYESKSAQHLLGNDLSSLILRGGAEIELPANRPLSVNINVPGAWSSILAYRLRVTSLKKDARNSETPFRSFIRQWVDDPYETKWHLNVEEKAELDLVMHGIAPFVPFKPNHHTLNIELWSSTLEVEAPVDIRLRIDFINSLRLLVLRYRLAIVGGCVSIVLLVMLIQFKIYTSTNRFPNFIHALGLLNSGKSLCFIISVLILLNPLVHYRFIQSILNFIDPVVLRDPNEMNLSLHKDFSLNSFYLGLEEVWLWPVGLILYLISTFLVFGTYQILINTGLLITSLIKLTGNGLKGSTQNQAQEFTETLSNPNMISSLWSYRRMIMISFLLLTVPLYAPYQFVYVACFLIQIITAIKILLRSSGIGDANLLNYQMSVLMLMLWVLPVNVPILIVFAHNITVNWKTPFSSHHNFLSIIPIFFLVQRNTNMKKLPRFSQGIPMIRWFIVYFVFYCLVYGIRHTFWIHHLFNVMSCLLLRIYHENEVTEDEKESL